MFAKEKPATLIWCMGETQHTVGTANVRAFCIACLATGNVGAPGTGANIFRGHTNVQGATDLGLDITTLPLYYGLTEGAWRHWARVWDVAYEWLQSPLRRGAGQGRPRRPARASRTWRRRASPRRAGSTPCNLPEEQIDQRAPFEGMIVMGHGGNTITRIPEAVKGLEKLDLLVVADPHPTTFAALGDRQGQHLPAADLHLARDATARARPRTARCNGASRSSSRSSSRRTTTRSCTCSRRSSASPTGCSRTSRSTDNVPVAEDILREINRGGWSTGYCGQSPERLKAHMRNQDKFDLVTLRAPKDDPEVGGDYYGLPWPCWGKPEIRHPGLADPLQHQPPREGRRQHLPGALRRRAQRRRRCWPRAPTRKARSSPTAIPSSPWAC